MKLKREPQILGKIHLDEVESEYLVDNPEWEVGMTRKGHTTTIREGHRTPGEALDAAIKWANDRGLRITIEGVMFTLYRPGELEK